MTLTNFLQQNAAKTEVHIIASESIGSMIPYCVGSLSSAVKSNLRNVFAEFDQAVYLDQHLESFSWT